MERESSLVTCGYSSCMHPRTRGSSRDSCSRRCGYPRARCWVSSKLEPGTVIVREIERGALTLVPAILVRLRVAALSRFRVPLDFCDQDRTLANTLHRGGTLMKRTHLCMVLVVAAVAAAACDPGDPRQAIVAVHTGAAWEPVPDNQTVTVLRDNPPLTGFFSMGPRGNAVSQPRDRNELLAQPFIYDGIDFRLDRTLGHTFMDARNGDGLLGIAPVGPFTAMPPPITRWHSNGLQLRPGDVVPIHMQRRVFVGEPYTGHWEWQDMTGTDGSVRLDVSTRIVGVHIIKVTEPGGQAPRLQRDDFELWLDGRTIDRTMPASSNGGALNSYIVDHDPRPGYDIARFDEVDDGRPFSVAVQEPDAVWNVCGERYGENIQFKLVAYTEVMADAVSQNCAHAATLPSSGTPYCVGGWATVGMPPDAPPSIPVAIVTSFQGQGVAQTWSQGIIFGQSSVFGNGGDNRNVLAHEIGHFLGYSDSSFLDGGAPAPNLMTDLSRNLTQHQCDVAYAATMNFPG